MSEERPLSVPPMEAVPAKANGAADDGEALAADDEATAGAATGGAPRPSSRGAFDATPAPAPTRFPGSDPGATAKRARARMTLKIPDDEVARPQLTPSAPPAALVSGRAYHEAIVEPMGEPSMVPIKASRIITIEPPPMPGSKPPPRPTAPSYPPTSHPPSSPPPSQKMQAAAPTGASSSREDSWTPYQPTVADQPPGPPPRAPTPVSPRARMTSQPSHASQASQRRGESIDDIPIVTDGESESRIEAPDSAEPLDLEDAEVPSAPHVAPSAKPAAAAVVVPTPPPPPAVAAPVQPPAHAPLKPASAVGAPVNIKDLPPMRALAPTEPEGEEVSFDDDEPSTGPRGSEPGDAAEIAIEDLVSVESLAPSAPRDGAQAKDASRASSQPRAMSPSSSAMTGAPAAATSATARPVSLPPPAASKAQPAAAPVTIATGPASAARSPRAGGTGIGSSPIAPPPMSESAPTGRRRARPWWEELFNDDFIRTMAKISDPQINAEADFIEDSLAVAKGAMVLDLACGTGRHAIELTRRGYKVVGFDLSLPMLARAADEAQERSQKLNFVQGDMREMTFEDTFDGIYCWNTSFGFFEEEKNAQVVARVHKALRKSGQFLLDVINRDFLIRQAPSLAWFEGEGCICMDEMAIDWITSRMRVKRTMMMDDGRTKEIEYSVRVYSLHELGKMLNDAGFRVAEVSGRATTPGVFFGNESPRTLILAEKR
jgi:SAM-dependent methyltransferase